MNKVTLPLNEILVEDRQRVDLGDVEALARSIERYGLIQPIVINQHKRLIAGGRRVAAHQVLQRETIECVYRETLSEDELKELELEENVRRKDMTWQERACSIADIHRLKVKQNVLAGESWGFAETGEMLGRAQSHVWYSLQAADAIRAKDPDVLKCTGILDFIKLLMSRKEAEALKKLAEQTTDVRVTATAVVDDQNQTMEEVEYTVDISSFLHFGDCLTLMKGMPLVDHIISDPPYAIDMKMLEQEGSGMDTSTVRDEHDVDQNLALLRAFIPLAYDTLKNNGFCVLWCDTIHFADLVRLAEYSGFRAQRWPLVWCKNQAMNQAASYNFTKATEVALVLRKPGAVLLTNQPSNWWQGGFEQGERELYQHPFAKPRLLWQWIARAVALPGQTILDPFAGEGSSTLAMIDAGYKPIAMECSETHYPVLLNNVKNAYIKMLKNVTFV